MERQAGLLGGIGYRIGLFDLFERTRNLGSIAALNKSGYPALPRQFYRRAAGNTDGQAHTPAWSCQNRLSGRGFPRCELGARHCGQDCCPSSNSLFL